MKNEELKVKNTKQKKSSPYGSDLFCLVRMRGLALSEASILGWHEVTGSRVPKGGLQLEKLMCNEITQTSPKEAIKKRTEKFVSLVRMRGLEPPWFPARS